MVALGRGANVGGLGLEGIGIDFTPRGIKVDNRLKTSRKNIYAAGDMATGQSLVVRAIDSGRSMAQAVDTAIKGFTNLS